MEQPSRRRSLIHLVNGTGHHDTAYFPPLEIRDIRIDLPRDVRRVRAVALDRDAPDREPTGGGDRSRCRVSRPTRSSSSSEQATRWPWSADLWEDRELPMPIRSRLSCSVFSQRANS